MKHVPFFLSVLSVLIFARCGGGNNADSNATPQTAKSGGNVTWEQVTKDVINSLKNEGETNFGVVARDDEKTKTGTEHFGSYGLVPYETYFVRSKSDWQYKGATLDVYRHLEVTYHKLSNGWTLDKARVFNSWLDKVADPISEATIQQLVKSNTWQSFGHNNAEVESITLVNDFYTMPGIENGILYPTEFSSKKVNCLVDIVFTDKEKKQGRYEIKCARDGVGQPWDKVISYRRIDEKQI